VLAVPWLILLPVWILLGVLLIFGILFVLSRIKGGRYLRPLFSTLAKIPFMRGLLEKASEAAMERSNPELASAMKKMQRSGALKDPMKAQSAMSILSREERRALMEMQEQQGMGVAPEATNRQMRRRLERAQRNAQRRGR
jgi:hypothetical protein